MPLVEQIRTKKFYNIGHRANAVKNLRLHLQMFLKAGVFVPGGNLKPSLMFAG
jgi:hypothetical protein